MKTPSRDTLLAKPIVLAIGVLALGVAGLGAHESSQGQANNGQEQSVQQDLKRDSEHDPIVARGLIRNTILDLGLRDAPMQADYQLASALLSLASDMDPGNAEYARLVVASAWSAGDTKAMIKATRRVIQNDPGDTVAQLRLVSSMINTKQTIEERLALYNRFLGDAGKSLDPSVRSRLALDAALLEREQGNATGFLERLRLATQLDVSNKAAASLAVQYYSQATNDPLSQLEYQIKLLFSDPLDPNVHLAIVRLLAKEGAFASAQRFLDNAIALFNLESGRTPQQIEEIRFALKWQIDGPKSVADELNPILHDRRVAAQSQIDSYIEADLPIDELIEPKEIRYDLGIDKIRLLAAYSDNDHEGTQAVLNDIQMTVNTEINAIGNMMNNRGVDRSQLLTQVVLRSMDFQVMRAIVGLNAQEIRKDMAQLIDGVAEMEAYFSVLEPMALYAEGKYQMALDEASKHARSPSLDLIRALSYERLKQTQQAVDLYTTLALGHSLEGFGAFARSRLIQLGYGERATSAAGHQMAQVVETVPSWIDRMNLGGASFIYLGIIEPPRKINPLEEPRITVRLRNIAPIPLALGPTQPINSRFLIVAQGDNQSAGFEGVMKSKVVELDHRLRLMPNEEFAVEVDADSFQTQWLLAIQPNVSIRQRWRLLQGFQPRISDATLAVINPDSDASIYGITNSPLGLTAETNIVQRLILPETAYPTDQLIAELGVPADRTKKHRVIAACVARLFMPMKGHELSGQEQADMVNALIDLYTQSSSSLQASMVLELPHRHQVPAMEAFDDHVVSSLVSDALINSTVDTTLLACALLTRTDAADSPIFDVLDQVNDPRLIQIAEIIKARIESGTPTLGLVGPGIDSMIPPKDFFGS